MEVKNLLGSNIDSIATVSLTELNNSFIVEITLSYGPSRINQVTVEINNGGVGSENEIESIILSNPEIRGEALVFTDTITLGVGAPINQQDGTVQTEYYDTVGVAWINPLNNSEVLAKGFKVEPSKRNGAVYFSSNAQGTDTISSLIGTENQIYVIVEDEVIDSSAVSADVVILGNTAGLGNAGTTFGYISPHSYRNHHRKS